MINELGLNGNELILYALIYGFSQDGQSEFHGSIRYIMLALDLSNPTVQSLWKTMGIINYYLKQMNKEININILLTNTNIFHKRLPKKLRSEFSKLSNMVYQKVWKWA